ncbi:MAG TPA: M20/M25/M40 family metallo-hydrolase [Woeseiaceae bacterium]|nr:M20/M25/M40 family metallo-hydrolase [Woeseiaceae bacterium]
MKKFYLVLVAGLIVCGCQAENEPQERVDEQPVPADTASDVEVKRPDFRLDVSNAFSADTIAPYAGDHAAIYQHIDANLDDHVAAIQRWIRQPSISAQNDGIQEMAEMLRDDLKDLGFAEAELVPTDGHPGVWGYYDAGADKTLMLYMMYDVQPVNPDDWQSPPFAAELVDHELGTVVMGRGATNQKGPERAFLNAVQSIIAVEGKLPVNLMVAAEGEEELGSPHYPQVIDKYEERLKQAVGAIFPINSQRQDGVLSMILGVKGIAYFELEARGGPHGGPTETEIHGSLKAAVDSPVWRLVQALASMTSDDGNTILIEDYYGDLRPMNEEEQRLMSGALKDFNEEQLKQSLGVERWIDGMSGEDAQIELLTMPTLNIDGIWAGYTGEGVKTILPHMATAKVDSRLPPGMDPDEALAKIRDHLNSHGFEDIEIRVLSSYPAAQTSVDAEMVRAAISVGNKYAASVTVSPRLAGSAPFYQFTERLGLPMVPYGIGYGTGAHAPNEIMLIHPREGSAVAGLAEIEKSYVDFLYSLAADRGQ